MNETKTKTVEMCCFVIAGREDCKNEAEFQIMENTRSDPDNYTYACTAHVGEMLATTDGFPDCKEWTVVSLYAGEEEIINGK